MVFYSLEPWGTKVEDFRAASIMSVFASVIYALKATVVRVWTGKRIKREKYNPQDFMPRYGEPKPKMKMNQMLQIVEALNKGMKGKDIRDKQHGNQRL